MPITSRSHKYSRLIPLLLLLLLVVSCESRSGFVGTYKADDKDSPRQLETILDLKANGEGVWKVGDEEVPFSWYIKDDELRLNTKDGGVITGAIKKNAFDVNLPAHGTLFFKKIH